MRTYDCVDCGTPCRRKRAAGQARVCIPCAGLRIAANAARYHYDALLRRQARAIAAGGGNTLAYPIQRPSVAVTASEAAQPAPPPMAA
jgi:hypothetical protein